MSGEEALIGAGSSASHVGEHHSTITRERWEEKRHLLSAADYGAMAAGAAGGMAAVDGKTVVSGGGVAVGAAGAMNEEFLRDYFNDVSIQPQKNSFLMFTLSIVKYHSCSDRQR